MYKCEIVKTNGDIIVDSFGCFEDAVEYAQICEDNFELESVLIVRG